MKDVSLPGLSVLIVNYNTGPYARDCIHSLLQQQGVDLEVIVVDNASKDDSLELLRSVFGSKVTLIASPQNLGFGRANNLAAQHASKDFLVILNPDTTIPDSGALISLIDYLIAHPELGVVGPAILEPRKNKQVLPRLRYPSARSIRHTPGLKHLPGKIAWLLGACLLMRRSVYQEIDGFDPDYFLYGEDADICLRLRQHGYEIGYHDEVKITHEAGVSELGAVSLDKYLRKKRGLYLFVRKHFDRRDALHLANTTLLKTTISLILTSVLLKLPGDQYKRLDRKSKLLAIKMAAGELKQALKAT